MTRFNIMAMAVCNERALQDVMEESITELSKLKNEYEELTSSTDSQLRDFSRKLDAHVSNYYGARIQLSRKQPVDQYDDRMSQATEVFFALPLSVF
jgi:hypothetical protein